MLALQSAHDGARDAASAAERDSARHYIYVIDDVHTPACCDEINDEMTRLTAHLTAH